MRSLPRTSVFSPMWSGWVWTVWTRIRWGITAAHPRGDFKNEFLRAFVDGLSYRPDTTYGTVNADVLEHFVPGFRSVSMVDRITGSAWSA